MMWWYGTGMSGWGYAVMAVGSILKTHLPGLPAHLAAGRVDLQRAESARRLVP
jgi:hypothetical protein